MEILHEDQNSIAIVVVGYNRLLPLRRLMSSLLRADYGGISVPLVISIDCSGDQEVYDYAQTIEWPYGNKYVNIQEKRLGLKNHILQCGDLSQRFKAIILLEDDIFVSEQFYNYVCSAIDFYQDDERVGGISLFLNEMWGADVPVAYYHDGSDTFLRQLPASWGECWTREQWLKFRQWYKDFRNEDFAKVDIPEYMKEWGNSWTKYFAAYLVETNRYLVYPYVSHTACFSDPGEHYNLMVTLGQSTLQVGKRNYCFRSFEKMTRYDVYGVNCEIYTWLGMSEKDVLIDWYGSNSNLRKCRYILTPIKMPFKVERAFGMYLHPIELNVKYSMEGDELKLYDTMDGSCNIYGKPLSVASANYYLRSFNLKLLVKYVISSYVTKIIRKFCKVFPFCPKCVFYT